MTSPYRAELDKLSDPCTWTETAGAHVIAQRLRENGVVKTKRDEKIIREAIMDYHRWCRDMAICVSVPATAIAHRQRRRRKPAGA